MIFLIFMGIIGTHPKAKIARQWYIWYRTPVSKLINEEASTKFFRPCAPKAPIAIVTAAKIEAVITIFLSKTVIFKFWN